MTNCVFIGEYFYFSVINSVFLYSYTFILMVILVYNFISILGIAYTVKQIMSIFQFPNHYTHICINKIYTRVCLNILIQLVIYIYINYRRTSPRGYISMVLEKQYIIHSIYIKFYFDQLALPNSFPNIHSRKLIGNL